LRWIKTTGFCSGLGYVLEFVRCSVNADDSVFEEIMPLKVIIDGEKLVSLGWQ